MTGFSFCTLVSSLHVFNPKNHKIKLSWNFLLNCFTKRSFTLNHFTKPAKINLRGSNPAAPPPPPRKKKKTHTQTTQWYSVLSLPESVPIFYTNTILQPVKTFHIQNFWEKHWKLSGKHHCDYERMGNSDLNPEVDVSLSISYRKVMITFCISKSYQLKFWLIGWVAVVTPTDRP